MASNVKTAAACRNAAVDALISNAALNGGTMELRNGTQPASPETGATGTLLATLTLNATAFGAASGGIATAGAITAGVGVALGTPTWARLKTAGGTAKIDLSAGISGTDVILGAASIDVGTNVTCSSLTYGISA
jgi:hypothetical protein